MHIAVRLLILLLSGFIAAYAIIPLLSYLFGVTITVTGASLVAGMYLYVLTAFIVSLGIYAALFVIVFIFLLIVAGVMALLNK